MPSPAHLSDFFYIEGLKDYVEIILPEEMLLAKELIGEIEQRPPPEAFLRIHRSFIVPRNKINAFTAVDVEIGKYEIPIGRTYKEVFVEWMEQ